MYNVHYFSQKLTFAGLKALKPRVIKVGVTFISALLEPSATTSATTQLAGFRAGAALGTCGTDCCRGGGQMTCGFGMYEHYTTTQKSVLVIYIE